MVGEMRQLTPHLRRRAECEVLCSVHLFFLWLVVLLHVRVRSLCLPSLLLLRVLFVRRDSYRGGGPPPDPSLVDLNLSPPFTLRW